MTLWRILPVFLLLSHWGYAQGGASGFDASGLIAQSWAEARLERDDVALQDGRILRLSGVESPASLAHAGSAAERRIARERRALLEDLLSRPPLQFWIAKKPDRWGRFQAHLVTSDGVWAQKALLEAGLVRLDPNDADKTLIDALRAAERVAREEKRGLWGLPAYEVRDGADMRRSLNRVCVVSGEIHAVFRTRKALFLVLGPDRTQALTIRIPPKTEKRLKLDPDALLHRPALARGWIGKSHGPLLELHNPLALEFQDSPP